MKTAIIIAALLLSTPAVALDWQRIPEDIESKNVREIPWALPYVHGITVPQYVIVKGKMRSTMQGPGIGRPTAASWDRYGSLEPWPGRPSCTPKPVFC